MTTQIIPIFKDASARWTSSIELDGVVYQLAFHWDDREAAFYLSLNTSDGVPILSGMKLMVGVPLMSNYRAVAGIPPGEFVVGDVQNDPVTAKVDWDGLGVRYQLVYATITDEVA